MKLIIILLTCIMLLAVGMVVNRLTINDQSNRLDRQDQKIQDLVKAGGLNALGSMAHLRDDHGYDSTDYLPALVFPDKHECCDSIGGHNE